MASDLRPVGATYRLQLGEHLTFAAAAALLDYLAALGVTHVYLSPVLEPRSGSSHGYDVADPGRVASTLGGRAGLEALAQAAHDRGLGLVADVVPNHLGVGADNPLWETLLAEGREGEAGGVFDVDWNPALPGAQGKVVLPVLGATYGEVLHRGELTVVEESGCLRVRYHEHSFPMAAASLEALERSGGAAALAGRPGKPETWTRLHALLEQQHYRLVHWRVGDALVNYRRFFAIADLAAVRVEDDGVYERTHAEILALVDAGVLDGLRVDHVDGLSDPAGYLERLRSDVGDAWVVVEKILAPGERLPAWPVQGTTGYEFLADVLLLHVDPLAEPALTALARTFGAWPDDLEEARGRAKREVLAADLASDFARLARRFWALCQENRTVRDVTLDACAAALRETVVAMDVYRAYTLPGEPAGADDEQRLAAAVGTARSRASAVPGFLWNFLSAVLRGAAGDGPSAREVLRRFHQLCGAVTAKGVEDTLLYRQHRLAALNEVGTEPALPAGEHVAAFHEANARRAGQGAWGMLSTATHDTKRGEDVRLRIAALTELTEAWREAVTRWSARHRGAVASTPAGDAPDRATEYLLYQTLVGVWPLEHARAGLEQLRERVGAYLVKAAREAGERTSWTDPDEEFERGVAAFCEHLLDQSRSPEFLDELEALCGDVAEIAMTAGLAQVLLRSTSPGVPDTYQGNELWDDSLVDPDNRRPVDFEARARMLAALDAEPPSPTDLIAARRDGRVKLWVLSRALRARRAHEPCFERGAGYRPLEVTGVFARHVVAFARTARGGSPAAGAVLVVAPRLAGAVIAGRRRPPRGGDWRDTAVLVDGALGGRDWRDELGGPGAAGVRLPLAEVLRDLPVALLAG